MTGRVAPVFIAMLISSAATSGAIYEYQNSRSKELQDKLETVEQQLSATQKDLIGYTKYTEYISESKKAIEERMQFLAAKVDRQYVQIEHIQKSTLGIKTGATVILKYSVEYSFGFDLRPDRFTVSGDKKGITITLNRPELVAAPAVNMLSHEIPATGFFINEQDEVIELQQQLFGVAKTRANELKSDEAVIALCEKKLAEFLRDFLAKQPNVGVIPVIKFAYK